MKYDNTISIYFFRLLDIHINSFNLPNNLIFLLLQIKAIEMRKAKSWKTAQKEVGQELEFRHWDFRTF